MLTKGDKLTVIGAKEVNSKKLEIEDFEVETKQDVEYLKAVMAIHDALERKIKVLVDIFLYYYRSVQTTKFVMRHKYSLSSLLF